MGVMFERIDARRVLAILALVFLSAFFIVQIAFAVSYFQQIEDVSAFLQGRDIRAFLTAADIVAQGEASHLYDLETQLQWQQKRFDFVTGSDKLLVYANPPFIATLYSLLSPLSSANAFYVVTGINVFLLLTAIAQIIRLAGQRTFLFKSLAVVSLLTSLPLAATFLHGQFSLLLFTVMLGSWHCFTRQRWLRGGMLLSLLLVKPQLILLPVIALMAMARWRAIAGLVGGVLTLLTVGLFAGGVASLWHWGKLSSGLMSVGDRYGIHPQGMYTLRSLLHVLYGSDEFVAVRTVWMAAVIVGVAVTGYLFSRVGVGSERRLGLAWGGMVTLMLLISAHSNTHDLLLLFIPCLALFLLPAGGGNRWLGVASLSALFWSALWLKPLITLSPPLMLVPMMVGLLAMLGVAWREEMGLPMLKGNLR